MYKRNPRFKRVPAVAPLWPTERDWQIIKLVHRHRFLRSDQIIALIDGSRQQLLRRLALLFHHGYLERPRAQLVRPEHGGSHKIVYGLGRKGGTLLRQRFGLTVYAHSWSERNHVFGRIYLEHALFVADVMVAIELACRKRGDVELLYEDELAIYAEKQPFRWQVQVGRGPKLGVVPDRVFALDFTDAAGQRQRIHFFLEADRGTMPVKRRTLSQTSFLRKMLTYVATWHQGIHQRQLGINRFRVLTVTTIPKRVETLVQACSELPRGQGLFLFADSSILTEDMLTARFQVGRAGETGTLLD
jgi:hypothetical protein